LILEECLFDPSAPWALCGGEFRAQWPELLPARLIGTGNYWRWKVNEIAKEGTGSILRIRLNRPQNKNAMTSNMYVSIAQLLNDPAGDDHVHLVLWHGAGDLFSLRMPAEPSPGLPPDEEHLLVAAPPPTLQDLQQFSCKGAL
jgi:hypothetical protein